MPVSTPPRQSQLQNKRQQTFATSHANSASSSVAAFIDQLPDDPVLAVACLISKRDSFPDVKGGPDEQFTEGLTLELSRRLVKAIEQAGQGTPDAVHILVTLACAEVYLPQTSKRAREALEKLTRNTASGNRAAGMTESSLAALATGYRRLLGPDSARWIRTQLADPQLDGRYVSVVDALKERESVGDASAEAAKYFSKIDLHAAQTRRNGKLFNEGEMISAMERLSGQGQQHARFDFYTVTHQCIRTILSSMHGSRLTLVAEAMGHDAHANQRPSVALWVDDSHYVALIAVPPIDPSTKATFVVFDSNASQAKDAPPSATLGNRLVQQLKGAGYDTVAAFGSIQEGMAANSCGPHCVQAIRFALVERQPSKAQVTKDELTARLKGYIEAFRDAPDRYATWSKVVGDGRQKIMGVAVVPGPKARRGNRRLERSAEQHGSLQPAPPAGSLVSSSGVTRTAGSAADSAVRFHVKPARSPQPASSL